MRQRIAGIAAGLVLGTAVSYPSLATISYTFEGSKTPQWLNPFGTTLHLPDDPCTQLRPFSTDRSPQQKNLAAECLQDEKRGEIVIVDFTGLHAKTEAKIARGTEALIRESSANVLTPKVVIMPASLEAKRELATSAPLGSRKHCVPIPSMDASPSAIAVKDMPEISKEYPHAFIVSFSPQIACKVSGLAYEGQYKGIATVYPNNTGQSGNAQLLADEIVTIHEAGGHLFNLGHGGLTVFSNDQFYPHLGAATFEDIDLTGSVYKEYGYGNAMGSVDAGVIKTISDLAPFNPINEDDLREPEAILRGDKALDARFIGDRWTTLTKEQINRGAYAMVPLHKPITLHGTNGKTTFDMFAILLTYLPSHKYGMDPYPSQATYGMEYVLYDSHNTHNTAYAEDQLGFPADKNYTIRIGTDQEIQLQGKPNGLNIRTFSLEALVSPPIVK